MLSAKLVYARADDDHDHDDGDHDRDAYARSRDLFFLLRMALATRDGSGSILAHCAVRPYGRDGRDGRDDRDGHDDVPLAQTLAIYQQYHLMSPLAAVHVPLQRQPLPIC